MRNGCLNHSMINRSFIPALVITSATALVLLLLPACKPAPAPDAKPATPTPAATAAPEATAPPVDSSLPTPPADPTSSPEASTTVELKDPVAVVNGEPISKAQLEDAFKAAVEATGSTAAELTAEQKLAGYRQILDELIMDKLVSKASTDIAVTEEDVASELAKLKKQFPTEEAFDEQMKQAGQSPEKLTSTLRTMIQQQRWMKDKIAGKDAVGENDAKTFYDSNNSEFQNPETVKASHILFMVKKEDTEEVAKAKEAAAKKAAARANKGENFTKLAKELSEEPGAKESGGDLGFFSKDRMVPEFSEVAFAQKPGDISKPVRTQFGWHVIKVIEKKPAGTMGFDEVKDQITTYLKSTKQREVVEAVLKDLKSQAKIESTLPPGA